MKIITIVLLFLALSLTGRAEQKIVVVLTYRAEFKLDAVNEALAQGWRIVTATYINNADWPTSKIIFVFERPDPVKK